MVEKINLYYFCSNYFRTAKESLVLKVTYGNEEPVRIGNLAEPKH
jgi:hypothetical protein